MSEKFSVEIAKGLHGVLTDIAEAHGFSVDEAAECIVKRYTTEALTKQPQPLRLTRVQDAFDTPPARKF